MFVNGIFYEAIYRKQQYDLQCVIFNGQYFVIVNNEDVNDFIDIEAANDFLEKYDLSSPVQALPSECQNNFNITGDQSRIVLQALLNANINYPGHLVPVIYSLAEAFKDISDNQPSVEENIQ